MSRALDRAARACDPGSPDPDLDPNEFLQTPCGPCNGEGGKFECTRCRGAGILMTRVADDDQFDEEVQAVIELHWEIEKHGLAACMRAHGSIKPSLLMGVGVFASELAKLDYERRVERAKKGRRSCPKKP